MNMLLALHILATYLGWIQKKKKDQEKFSSYDISTTLVDMLEALQNAYNTKSIKVTYREIIALIEGAIIKGNI